ncbi:MAG: hypothetical protein P8Y24_13835 [Gammaproteobacteria bacterium]
MNRLAGLFLVFTVLVTGQVFAGEVEIVHTRFEKESAGSWHVSTTLKHADSGWSHYADAWRVVDENGKELGTRTLFHPHENEQPFTRSDTVQIPDGITIVYVEAHDKVHGWSKQRVRVDLTKDKGDRFEVRR